MTATEYLQQLMEANYRIDNVVAERRFSFKNDLLKMLGNVDWEIEGLSCPTNQRDLSIRFCWGHNHDFGEFSLSGRMGNRHIEILADFINRFDLPKDLSGKRVLDVGVWTGGTSLLLAALGAEVVAIEEVKKYSDTVNSLAHAFGLSSLVCHPISVYELDEHDVFDFVIYSGVIYHVTDPILSLRLLFNALKDGGRLFIETLATNVGPEPTPLTLFEGPSVIRGGRQTDLNRGGWNYFVPSHKCLGLWLETVGFEDTHLGSIIDERIQGTASRNRHKDMLRAGLSRPRVR